MAAIRFLTLASYGDEFPDKSFLIGKDGDEVKELLDFTEEDITLLKTIFDYVSNFNANKSQGEDETHFFERDSSSSEKGSAFEKDSAYEKDSASKGDSSSNRDSSKKDSSSLTSKENVHNDNL